MTAPNLNDIASMIASGKISPGAAAASYSLTASQLAQVNRLVESLSSDVKTELLDHMKSSPQFYYPQVMRAILNGNFTDEAVFSGVPGPLGRFAKSGEGISWTDLLEAGIVNPSMTPEMVMAEEDLRLPVYSIKEYSGDIVDRHRTDVFLLGIAGSGKSSLACSLIRQLVDSCDYEYQPLRDGVDEEKTSEYFRAVMEITRDFHKPVAASLADNLLFAQLRDRNSRRRLTVIDGDSSVMADLAKLLSKDSAAVRNDTVYRIMANSNSKILLFLLDYRHIKARRQRTLFRQSMMIESVINALSTDGDPGKPEKNCSFSRVEGVAFVITKCDTSEADALNVINAFIEESMKTVMMRLEVVNQKFGINKDNGYRPYILPVSLGRFTVGNTFGYDPQSSRRLAELVARLTPTQWPWHC